MKNKFVLLLLCLLIPLIVGFLSGIATAESITTWYAGLNKPFFNPPNFLFGPVWTLLYILMGVSLFLVLRVGPHPLRSKAIVIFSVQLVLNALWSFIFFAFHAPGWALLEIGVLWTCILYMIFMFGRISRVAGLLQIPYLLWVTFATLLNAAIFYLN